MTNKLLFKQANENKQHVKFLEESISCLQENLRGAVHEGIEADSELHTRVKTLQGLLDSLTGPAPRDDSSMSGYSVDIEEEQRLLTSRLHLPPRGKAPSKLKRNGNGELFSHPKCLMFHHKGKRKRKRPEAFVHHAAKFIRKQRSTGTALIGKHRLRLQQAYEYGKTLLLPGDDGDDGEDDDGDLDSVTTDGEDYEDYDQQSPAISAVY